LNEPLGGADASGRLTGSQSSERSARRGVLWIPRGSRQVFRCPRAKREKRADLANSDLVSANGPRSRRMPSFCMRARNEVRLIPSRVAAPLDPESPSFTRVHEGIASILRLFRRLKSSRNSAAHAGISSGCWRSVRELAPDGDDGSDAAPVRHLQIHQSDVRRRRCRNSFTASRPVDSPAISFIFGPPLTTP
jgi:hypothetical protein